MNIEDVYSRIKIAKEELDFARVQMEASKKQVSIAERRVKELVTQLAKLTGVSVGNNSKAIKSTYTEEDDINLRKWWDENLTAREIGERLGKKPSSVNSRIARLGLSRRPRLKKEAA